MTDIIFHRRHTPPPKSNEKTTFDLVKVKQLDIHFAGEDQQYVWMELFLEDDTVEQTPYLKAA